MPGKFDRNYTEKGYLMKYEKMPMHTEFKKQEEFMNLSANDGFSQHTVCSIDQGVKYTRCRIIFVTSE